MIDLDQQVPSMTVQSLYEAIHEAWPNVKLRIKRIANGEEVVLLNEFYHIWTAEDWAQLSHDAKFAREMEKR